MNGLQNNEGCIYSIIVMLLLLLCFFLFFNKKRPGSIVGSGFLSLCLIFGIIIVGIASEWIEYPGTIFLILQVIFIFLACSAFTTIGIQYYHIVSKKQKSNQDIVERKKYIEILSFAIAANIVALPFIVNSYGINLLGNLEPHAYETYENVKIEFIKTGILVGFLITIPVFLADNIIGRIVTPILTADEAKELSKFCLYLRSFSEDNNKQEKLICKVAKRLYPVYAIGDPNHILQPNGATRIYATDNDWKDVVTELSLKSKLILLRIGQTKGTLWEIGNIINTELIHKTIFIAYNSEDYHFFIEKIKNELGLESNYAGEVSGNPIAFFWDIDGKFRWRTIYKAADVEFLINVYISTTPSVEKEYNNELKLRNNSLKYMFDDERIPLSIRNSLNWGIFSSPIVNMRHWPITVWGLLILSFIISVIFSKTIDYTTFIPTYSFILFFFFFGNRIEWAVGSWSSDTMFLKSHRREAKLMWLCFILGLLYSIVYINLINI